MNATFASIVHRARRDTVTDLGQVSKDEAIGTTPTQLGIPEFEPGESIANKEAVLGPLIRPLVLASSSFQSLQTTVERFKKRLYGKVEWRSMAAEWAKEAAERPWELLSAHAGVWDARSNTAWKLRALADAVIAETGLPMCKPGPFRGMDYRVDWDKLRELLVGQQ